MTIADEGFAVTLTDEELLRAVLDAQQAHECVREWRGRLLMELGARLRTYGVRALRCENGDAVLELEASHYVLTEAQAEQLRCGADIQQVLDAARTAPRQWIRVRRHGVDEDGADRTDGGDR